ncbi:MAG: DNA-binding GntR family transcriptional regulator [Paraglaciecola sp.]|jgi:DNA-binding GntR family transcriptional regulator
MGDKQAANTLFIRLKQDIRNNNLPLNEPLKQADLAQRYQVSRIPVRDVLQRLKNEGWLVQSGKRGVMVQPLSAIDAQDLYQMRMLLEPMLLAYAIPNLSNQNIGQAQDILQQARDSSTLSINEQGELNWQFHACLYQPALHPVLFDTVARLHQLCARYIGFHSVELDHLDTSHEQHAQLLVAISNKQTTLAQQLLGQHISQAGEILVAYINPE